MASYTVASEMELTDHELRCYYEKVKSAALDFSYDDLDIIFDIALSNKGLFPSINLSENSNPEAYFERWVRDYRGTVISPPHSRVANSKSACSDPAVMKIVMMTQGISEEIAAAQERSHNLFMSAENIQGKLLEEYVATSIRPYGWIWCAGNALRAIDFCSSDGKVLLQVKNKSNTENSSSSNIRHGTSIKMWYRLGTRTVKGRKVPSYKWELLNAIVNGHITSGCDLPPCQMSEEHYIQFISNLATLNPHMITSE